MKTPFHIGIIGVGSVARFHARAITEIPSARIAGFCDGGSGRARTLAEQYRARAYPSYEALLNDEKIDVVTIATPSGLHLEPAVLAAEKGKHVLCEKPLEIRPERVEKMIRAHEKAGTHLGGIFNYRYDPVVSEIKKAVDTGRLGRLTYAAVRVPWWRDEAYYTDNWKGTRQLDGGGALMNQSIHMVDLLQYLCGPIRSVFAYTATLAHDIEVEDTAVAVLRFGNGALGQVYGSTASYPGQFRQLDITGTRGSIQQVDDSLRIWQFAKEEPGDEEIRKKYGTVSSGGGVSDPSSIPYENHRKNIEGFLAAIKEGRPFEIDGKEAKKAVDIVCAVYESQRVGREVLLPHS